MLVYDIEIKKAILGKGEKPQEGVEYCAGWNDHENMGVSTVCAYDYTEDRCRVFCDDNLEEFSSLTDTHDVIVSFNGINFDNKVLAHATSGFVAASFNDLSFDNKVLAHVIPDLTHYKRELERLNEKSYDIFAKIREASGQWCSLDATVKANGLAKGKTGCGAEAPSWYQTGQWGRLVDYCLMDVYLTKQIFDLVLAGNPVVNPKSGKEMILGSPHVGENKK